jgi:hypothetical protein
MVCLPNSLSQIPAQPQRRGGSQPNANLEAAHREALRFAVIRLAECDPPEVCSNTKATFEEATGCFQVDFFGAAHRIEKATGVVARLDSAGQVPVTEQVLILHYLTHAKPSHLWGRAISFREIPGGGAIYCPSFQLRAIDPLVKAFSDHFDAFSKAAAQFGGSAETVGDRSFTLKAFPLVPITYAVWAGDEEIPAAGTILFDASAGDFLPVEDLVLAASFGTYRLVGSAKEAQS